MPSAYSNGLTNAEKLFDTAGNGDVTFFTVVLTTVQTVGTAAHGLSGSPDFVLFQVSSAAGIGSTTQVGWSATSTTLTVTSDNTAGTDTLSVFAAKIA